MALDSFHRTFMCFVSFDLHSHPGRPAGQGILFALYAYESQGLEAL